MPEIHALFTFESCQRERFLRCLTQVQPGRDYDARRIGHPRTTASWIGRTGRFLVLLVVAVVLSDGGTLWGQAADGVESKTPKSALGAALESDAARRAAGEEPEQTVVDKYLEEYVGPDDKAAVAFLPPPGATSISKTGRLWVDRKLRRVYIDGYVAMREGALEMFACPVGTKEHESIVGALAKSREVHAGLLAIGAKPGSPVKFLPEFVPPKGQVIRVWVCWRDEDGKFHVTDARKWVLKNGTDADEMTAEWVFAGSGFWKDPSDGREYYRADGGDMICVSNFSTAMIDVNVSSSAEANDLQYIPFVDRIPKRETPVRLVLTPVVTQAAPANDHPAKANPAKDKPNVEPAAQSVPTTPSDRVPTEDVLPINPAAAKSIKK
ncbi:MAG: hypothetical protein HKN47_18155 [Pirellulaceae bacterium]|nr:hypothetical protein [Pirellulaceae bacterium]